VLDEHGISASVKQIGKKLTELKNYYGAQRRMIESSKTSGAGTDDVFTSNWKFFDSLEFLSDAFTPRKTKSNADNIQEEAYRRTKMQSLLQQNLRKSLP
jgi:hypothetical protein